MTASSDDSDKPRQGINRREFMQVTGAGALSTALPNIPLSDQEIVRQAVLRQRESMTGILEAIFPVIDGDSAIPAETVRKRCAPALQQAARHTREAFRLKQQFGMEGKEYALTAFDVWINPQVPTEYVLSSSNVTVREFTLDTPDKLIAFIRQQTDKAIHHLCEVLPPIRAREKEEASAEKVEAPIVTENRVDWSKLCDDTQNVFHAARGEQDESRMERLLRQRIAPSKSNHL